MTGLLPIYRAGSLKHFQQSGNFQQWNCGIISSPKEFILPFFSKKATTGTIASFLAYRLNEMHLYNAFDRTDLTAARIETIVIPTTQILQDSNNRYYCIGNQLLGTYLTPGVYELYFTDNTNEFESEIFKVCDGIYGNMLIETFDTTYFKWDTTLITFDKV